MRRVERQARDVKREEDKFKREIQQAAKRNDVVIAKMIAKNIVSARRTVNRLESTKAQLNSISMQLQQEFAMQKVAGIIGKSSGIMKSMNSLLNVPELSMAMRTMASEMTKAGIISEMIEDTMDSVQSEGIEEEADEAVEAIMYEMTQGTMGKAPAAPIRGITGIGARLGVASTPATAAPAVAKRVAVIADEDDPDTSAVLKKFENL
jgi:charged multivesicular body protein 3